MTWRARLRGSKYDATPTEIDGHKFDSKAEARRYLDLRLLMREGSIRELEVHPPFELTCGGRPVLIRSDGYPNGRTARYEADFAYVTAAGERVVEDVKGFDTAGSRLKRAMLEAETGIVVRVLR